MSEDNVQNKLREMVAEILEEEPEDIDANANFVEDLGMDSMMALEILAGIEKEFKVVVPEDLLTQFTSLSKTTEIVNKLINDQAK